MSKGIVLFLFLSLLPSLLFGEGFGSKGLLHVQTASTLKPRRLDFRTNLKFFTKVGDFLGQQKPTNFSAVNYWDVQSNALLTYGIAEHFDGSVTVQTYQDVHKRDNEANAPGDIFLDLKVGSFGVSNNRFNLGGQFSMRFPTGESVNYPFEKYTAGGLEFGVTGLFSFYNDPFLPDRDYSLHVNLGWYNYNDAGKTILETSAYPRFGTNVEADGNASSFLYGLGFVYPTELFDVNLELWGNAFISQPDSFVFSRENYTYITPSIRFKPRPWINFDLGLDLRVSSDEDNTSSLITFQRNNLDLPNYPSWRMTLGLNLVLNGGSDRLQGGIGDQGDVRNKVDFYERLLQEREKTRSIEEELKRLKREREQAEKELEELRQLLEEEG